jgi:hypothetical protein
MLAVPQLFGKGAKPRTLSKRNQTTLDASFKKSIWLESMCKPPYTTYPEPASRETEYQKRKPAKPSPCCSIRQCFTKYSEEAVGLLRRYYHSLSKPDRRAFIASRRAVNTGANKLLRMNNGTQKAADFRFFLEKEENLRRRFHISDGRLHQPEHGEHLQPVCSVYLAWILGVCRQTIRINRERMSRVEGVQLSGLRYGKLKHVCLEFLRWCKERFNIMPDKDMTVLPWRTINMVHVALVRRLEEVEIPYEKRMLAAAKMKKASKEDDSDSDSESGSDEEKQGHGSDGYQSGEEARSRKARRKASTSPAAEVSEESEEAEEADQGCRSAQCVNRNCRCFNIGKADDGCTKKKARLGRLDQRGRCEEEDVSEEAEEDEDIRYQMAQTKPTKYRYGNRLCGRVEGEGALELIRDIPSLSYFRYIWSKDTYLKHSVVIRKHMPFAKCDLCFRLRDLLYHTTNSPQIEKHRKELEAHIRDIKDERAELESWRKKARQNPSEVCVMGIDGMDNSDNTLPHFSELFKLMANGHGAPTHVLGVLVSGREPHAFISGAHIRQGHNTTIQAIFKVLAYIKKKDGKIPKTLIVSLDNTTKQNKGKFVACFIWLLVHYKVVVEAKVLYLPVGHTHEEVDQFFSRLSMYLRLNDALSRKQLAECIFKRSSLHTTHSLRSTPTGQ